MVTYEHQCVCLLFLLQLINTFLSVKHADHKAEQKSLYVKQSPQSVLPGDSVTLRCSLLSRNEETRVQCPGERSAYWFRAASGESRPSVIYTQSHSSCDEERRSCVYRLSNTVKTSDQGTYYCAVDACGEILFGGGTKVQPSMFTSILISRKTHTYSLPNYFRTFVILVKTLPEVLLKCNCVVIVRSATKIRTYWRV